MRRKPYFQATSYSREKRNKGSMMVGVLVGIVIGVAAVMGIAIYLNYVATPLTHKNQFVDDENASETLASMPASSSQVAIKRIKMLNERVSDQSTMLDKSHALDAPAEKKFDFYKILPGDADIASDKPKELLNKKKLVVSQRYLQIGSFQNAADADNLKAKLALIGINARIQSTDIPNQGLIHRVRIGPMDVDSIEPMKVLLLQNGIQATVVTYQ